jgi:hypothetical protein
MSVVAGIALPEGNPGAVEAAAASLTQAAGDFDSAAGTVRQAEGAVGAWRGIASFTFSDRCGIHSEAARAGGDACQRAAVALRRFGRRLEDARDRVRELQRQAEQCVRQIEGAEARAGAAALRETAAEVRGFAAGLAGGADAGALQAAAQRDAQAAQAERAQAEREAAAARAELERLRARAEEEREQVERQARATAGVVRGAAGLLPRVQYPPAPPAPHVEEEDGGGLLDGVLGVVHGGLDIGGFFPGAGAIPDLVNAGIYELEGKHLEAGISLGAAVPIAGDIGKGAKMIKEGAEAAAKAGRTAKTVEELASLARSRADELQAALPDGSRGRVTMGVGVGEDAAGNIRVVVGTSEPNGYLRPGVGPLREGEELAAAFGHAEDDIVNYMRGNGIRPITVAAGRPICPDCAGILDDAGALPGSPLKEP